MFRSTYTLLLFLLLVQACTQQVETSWEEEAIPGINWMSAQRIYPHGDVDHQAITAARSWRKTEPRTRGRALMPRWESVGPTNVGGRISDLEFSNHPVPLLFAGAASGGVWRSADRGDSWEPIFDDAGSLSIGDIALAPSDNDVIYLGTGEANGGGGSLTYDGDGVWKSDDKGNTWTHLGLENVGTIGRVSVHPEDPNTVYVAATGRLFAKDSDRGLYRTTDGGANWEQLIYVNDSTGFIDLVINPENPDIIYAAAWERTRTVSQIWYGGVGSAIYRSEDGGENWEELTSGLPSDVLSKGRITLAIAPQRPETLYAYYTNSFGGAGGFYRSTNGGDSWVQRSANDLDVVPFMYWFGRMEVHPDNPDEIFFSSLNNHRSVDGGANWTSVFQGVHVDQHAIAFDPQDSDNVFIGNDGGVYYSTNRGANWTFKDDLPITQFYNASLDPQFPERLYGGTQDNNCIRSFSGDADDFQALIGGDGFFTLVEPGNSNVVYAESQNGFLQRSLSGGTPGTFATVLNGIPASDRRNWRTPYAIDPLNPERLYYGTFRVFRSDNRAGTWSATSPDLTKGNASGSRPYGTITSISPSPLVEGLVYVGTDDGKVWRSDNGGNDWTDLSAGMPDRWVTSVAASGFDPEEVYVTYSGYRFGEFSGQVFRSTDRGGNWTNFGGDLPDVPVNEIVVDPEEGRLFLATDIGVFLRYPTSESWELLSDGMPAVVVSDLEFHPPTKQLLAGTYGRSLYRLNTETLVGTASLPNSVKQLSIFPNPARNRAALRLETASATLLELSLVNIQGRVVRPLGKHQLPVGESIVPLDLEGLTGGTFVVSGRTNDGSFSRQLIVL